MSTTRDYLEYLNDKVDIAPVNSEEEYQASELLASLMESHGLETRVQDFSAPGLGRLLYRVLGITLFLGVFLVGLPGTGVRVFGFILMTVSFILLALDYLGVADLLSGIGPQIHSQNVIGVHRATGPLVAKGNRPIVVIAHYDTPRENLYSLPQVARWTPYLKRFVPACVCIAFVFGLFQSFGFLFPPVVCHVLWILALIASLPLLFMGVAAVHERFSPCTMGANDNKSGVAAMLGVMDKVRPSVDDATGYDRGPVEQPAQLVETIEEEEVVPAQEGDAPVIAKGPDLDQQAAAEEAAAEEVAASAPADVSFPVGQGVPDVPVEVPVSPEELAAEQVGLVEDSPELGEAYEEQEAPAAEEAAAQAEEFVPEASEAEQAEPQLIPIPEQPPAPRFREELVVERVEGVRHGEETLMSLGILPPDCEVVYEEPRSYIRRIRLADSAAPSLDATTARPAPVASPRPTAPQPAAEFVPGTFDETEAEEAYEQAAAEGDGFSLEDKMQKISQSFAHFGARAKDFFGRTRETISERLAKTDKKADEEYDEEPYEGEEAYSEEYEEGYEPQGQVSPEPVAEDDFEEPLAEGSDAYQEYAGDEQPVDDQATAPEPEPEPLPEDDEFAEYMDFVPQPLEKEPEIFQVPTQRTAANPEAGADQSQEPTDAAEGPAETGDPDATVIAPVLTFINEPDQPDDPRKDISGLDNFAPDATLASQEQGDQKPHPRAPEDPDWGKSTYRPAVVTNVARRAVLFDLPDPSKSGEMDPFSDDLDSTAKTKRTVVPTPAPTPRSKAASLASLPGFDDEPAEEVPTPEQPPARATRGDEAAAKQGQRRRGIFSRKRKADQDQESMSEWLGVEEGYDAKKDGRAIGTWDNFDDDKNHWKGGATTREGLRVIDGGSDIRVQETLEDAVLSMGDDELIAHDVWFVALGGSFANHAGIKAFLADNRSNVRGAFVVNLSCVGAGDLSILTNEGLVGTRKADRRMGRLLLQVASDLHINLNRTRYDWESTDATPAMQASMRATTIAGLTPEGALALSQSADDEPDMVDPAQVNAVTQMVTELIRRS